MENRIHVIRAREILDSRGEPTVEATVVLENGVSAHASVPAGASTGVHEALELRDGGTRYGGRGVQKACKNITSKILPSLKGMSVSEMRTIDSTMIDLDGTKDKSNLGANAILAVSMATCRAGSVADNIPLYEHIAAVYGFKKSLMALPIPLMNLFNGGKHASTNLAIQEVLIIPQKPAKFKEKVRAGSEIFHTLKKILVKEHMDTDVGDEGGYAPQFKNTEHAFALLNQAVRDAGYELGSHIKLGIDAAASNFYDTLHARYTIPSDSFEGDYHALMKKYQSWAKKYFVWSIEDGLAEDDWEGWEDMTRALGGTNMLIGDDLFVTQVPRLAMGIKRKVANAILVKVNQVGSVSETIDTITLAQKNGYACAVSHRSGDTDDSFIADLVVATHSEFIKTGSMSRMERIVKYNRLMQIEDELERTDE